MLCRLWEFLIEWLCKMDTDNQYNNSSSNSSQVHNIIQALSEFNINSIKVTHSSQQPNQCPIWCNLVPWSQMVEVDFKIHQALAINKIWCQLIKLKKEIVSTNNSHHSSLISKHNSSNNIKRHNHNSTMFNNCGDHSNHSNNMVILDEVRSRREYMEHLLMKVHHIIENLKMMESLRLTWMTQRIQKRKVMMMKISR